MFDPQLPPLLQLSGWYMKTYMVIVAVPIMRVVLTLLVLIEIDDGDAIGVSKQSDKEDGERKLKDDGDN